MGLPFAAAKLDMLGVGRDPQKLRPGGAMIPAFPKGPDWAQPKALGPLDRKH